MNSTASTLAKAFPDEDLSDLSDVIERAAQAIRGRSREDMKKVQWCSACEVGSEDTTCWLCDGPMFGGNVQARLKYITDHSMQAAHTNYAPHKDDDIADYKHMDGLTPRLELG